jgi:hypothetical protein
MRLPPGCRAVLHCLLTSAILPFSQKDLAGLHTAALEKKLLVSYLENELA